MSSAGPVHKCVLELSREDPGGAGGYEAYQHSLSTLVSFAKLFREEYLGLAAADDEVGVGDEAGVRDEGEGGGRGGDVNAEGDGRAGDGGE